MLVTQASTIELSELPAPSSLALPTPAPSSPSLPTTPPAPARDPSSRVFDVSPVIVGQRRRQAIISLVICANFIQFVSNFTTTAGGFAISKDLGREVGPAQSNWMAAAYPLTQGTFVLVSGRIGAIYGHQRIVLLGGSLFALFTLANGFAPDFTSFIALRVFTGIGGGLLMPNAVALMTIMIPPGRARNVAMGFFGVAAPLGGYLGGVLVGVFTSLAHWRWMFVLLAGLEALTLIALVAILPKEKPVDPTGKIDFIGAVLGLGSLLLFNFTWNQAPSAGWSTPYIIACLVLSVVGFGLFLVWEGRYAAEPIMPLGIFQTPTLAALIFVVLLAYMAFGISQWYTLSWLQLLRGWSVLDTALAYSPFLVVGPLSVALAAWLIPRLEARRVLAAGVAVTVISNLLVATMPVHQSYWAQTFPSIVLCCLCPDFVYVAAQLIASNSVGRRHQGVAGSLVGTLNLYGNGLGLGFAGTLEVEVARSTGDGVLAFRAALWFGMALGAIALALDLLLVRVPKDDREGWDPDDTVSDSLVVGTSRSLVEGATQRR